MSELAMDGGPVQGERATFCLTVSWDTLQEDCDPGEERAAEMSESELNVGCSVRFGDNPANELELVNLCWRHGVLKGDCA